MHSVDGTCSDMLQEELPRGIKLVGRIDRHHAVLRRLTARGLIRLDSTHNGPSVAKRDCGWRAQHWLRAHTCATWSFSPKSRYRLRLRKTHPVATRQPRHPTTTAASAPVMHSARSPSPAPAAAAAWDHARGRGRGRRQRCAVSSARQWTFLRSGSVSTPADVPVSAHQAVWAMVTWPLPTC